MKLRRRILLSISLAVRRKSVYLFYWNRMVSQYIYIKWKIEWDLTATQTAYKWIKSMHTWFFIMQQTHFMNIHVPCPDIDLRISDFKH